MSEEWKKIEMSPTWNGKGPDGGFPLRPGDEMIGTFLNVEREVGEWGANLYSFKTSTGEIVAVWGGTVLDTRLKNLEMGEEVKIIYIGDVKGEKGKPYHNYEVYHRKVEIPVINE